MLIWIFKKIKPITTSPYFSVSNATFSLSSIKHINANFLPLSSDYTLTGLSDTIYGFNMDLPINFKFNVQNYNSLEPLKNSHIQLVFKVYDKNGRDITSDMEIIPSTGYETKLANLLNWNFSFGDLSKNALYTGLVKIRIEPKNYKYQEVYLAWSWYITYDLLGPDGVKTIKDKINWHSTLKLKYWGVYVVWLFTNSVKWLYEVLRNSSNNSWMSNSSEKQINELKLKTYNRIIRNVTKIVSSISKNTSEIDNGVINGIYYNKGGDITISSNSQVKWKSLIYANWWNVIIKWNIKKKWWILTIVAKSDTSWKWWHIYIAKNVTNIDAILVADKWIFPLWAKEDEDNWNHGYMLDVVKWNKNSELNNQLLIYGMVISRWNTVWWSIKIDGKYVLPGGKEIPWTTVNFYHAAISDLNYLRRYHYSFNPGEAACKPTDNNYDPSCSKLATSKYGTYPVIIRYDPAINTLKPYGF